MVTRSQVLQQPSLFEQPSVSVGGHEPWAREGFFSTPHPLGFLGTWVAARLQIATMSQPPSSDASTTARLLQTWSIPWRDGPLET